MLLRITAHALCSALLIRIPGSAAWAAASGRLQCRRLGSPTLRRRRSQAAWAKACRGGHGHVAALGDGNQRVGPRGAVVEQLRGCSRAGPRASLTRWFRAGRVTSDTLGAWAAAMWRRGEARVERLAQHGRARASMLGSVPLYVGARGGTAVGLHAQTEQ